MDGKQPELKKLTESPIVPKEFKKADSVIKTAKSSNTIYQEMLEREIWRLNGERDATCYILHEDVIQLLVAAKNYLQAIEQNESYPLRETVGKVDSLIGDAFQKIKEIHQQIASPPLGLFGLDGAIEELVYHAGKKSKIEIRLKEINPDINRIEDYQQLGIYKIVKQLLDNSLQHARAKKIIIDLVLTHNNIILEYQDDGMGFYNSKKFWRTGLLLIETLIATFQGNMNISTSPGTGFRLKAFMVIMPQTQKEFELKKIR